MGVVVLGHLGLLLDVPLVGLLDEASNVELGGVLHLPGHQLLLGVNLPLLRTCGWQVIFSKNQCLGLLTNPLLQPLEGGLQLGVGVAVDHLHGHVLSLNGDFSTLGHALLVHTNTCVWFCLEVALVLFQSCFAHAQTRCHVPAQFLHVVYGFP